MKTYEYNVVSDLSTLSTIPEKAINKLNDKLIYCICDAVAEAVSENPGEDKSVDLNLGFGILSIGVANDTVKYKFIPSSSLDTNVKQAVLDERNLLEEVLEKSFVDKITHVYKELI